MNQGLDLLRMKQQVNCIFIIDGVFYDALTLKKANIPAITYGEVDLGLSVKWADRNVGAETPQDNGAYFPP